VYVDTNVYGQLVRYDFVSRSSIHDEIFIHVDIAKLAKLGQRSRGPEDHRDRGTEQGNRRTTIEVESDEPIRALRAD